MTVSGNKFILRMFGLVARHGNNESDKLGRGNNLTVTRLHRKMQMFYTLWRQTRYIGQFDVGYTVEKIP